ncbi:MAG: sodium:solute symporter family protein [Dehalococcoidales bacterium]|nr:sodium:solute symporter family protein [Dehalococcoidales bacterium]
MLELAIIALYFLLMLTIGLASRRDIKKPDDFFVADRRSSTLLVTGSLLATIIGGSATVGMAGLGFTRGLTGAWWLLSGTIGLLVLGIFFARKVRRFALYTLPELVEKQYGRNMALGTSILIVISWLGIIAAQIVAAGKILSILQIGNPVLWMIIFTIVFVTYTAIGGQYSVLRTDIIQAVIIFIGVLAGLVMVLTRVGGWAGLSAVLPAGQFAFPVSAQFGGADLLAMLLIVGLTYVVGPDMYSRLFCTRDEKSARTVALWTAGLMIPLAFAITIIGMGAAALFPAIAAEQAFPTIIKEVFSPLIGSIFIAALISAVMSSADTTLLSASTIFIVDIVGWFRPQQKNILPYSRWLIVILGAGSLIIALSLQGVISAMLFAYTIYTCGVILPVIAGFFKDRLKVTPAGGLAALIGGGTAGLLSKILAIKYLDLGALGISIALLFGVSLLENALRHRRAAPLLDKQES